LEDQKGDAVAVTTALRLEEQRRKFEDRRGALIGKFYRVGPKMENGASDEEEGNLLSHSSL
jgi:hypothetical protein